VSAISYLGVAFTHVLESTLLGNPPHPVQMAGAATLCAAGILVSGAFRRGPAPAPPGEAWRSALIPQANPTPVGVM
jgi:hypothetical protein